MKQSTGIGLTGLVFLVFLTLKLAEIGSVATWSWWWVTAPLWMGAAIVLCVLIIMLLFVIIAEKRQRRMDEWPNYPSKTKSKFQQRLEDAEKQRKKI